MILVGVEQLYQNTLGLNRWPPRSFYMSYHLWFLIFYYLSMSRVEILRSLLTIEHLRHGKNLSLRISSRNRYQVFAIEKLKESSGALKTFQPAQVYANYNLHFIGEAEGRDERGYCDIRSVIRETCAALRALEGVDLS